jgi:hypothetical protein
MRRISIGFALLAACSGGETDDTAGPPEWRAVFSEVRSGLLRAWGYNSQDVYVVGADAEGSGPQALHFDGRRWKDLDPPVTGDLWWVQGVDDDDVRMVGEGGMVLVYTPSTDSFEVRQAPTEHVLFGVWGASSSDVWYVGGDVGRNRGVILRDDGDRIVEVMHTSTASAAFFKVFGVDEETIWFVGQRGTALRWNGSELVETETPTGLPLMGVHGIDPDRVYAVGGVSDGVMLAWNGSAWEAETPPGAPQMIGVWASDREDVHACGFNGNVYRRSDGAWSMVAEKIPTFQDLHAIWVDDDDAIWAVGGRLAENPPTGGVLIRWGSPISSEVE